MLPKQWIRSPYQLLWVFLSITLVLASILGWLAGSCCSRIARCPGNGRRNAWKLPPTSSRLRSNGICRSSKQDLTRLATMSREGLARGSLEFSRDLPGDSVLLLFSPDGVEPLPGDRLLFHRSWHLRRSLRPRCLRPRRRSSSSEATTLAPYRLSWKPRVRQIRRFAPQP